MRRVLIVDDNHAFAENLAEILRDLGNEVEIAGDGQEALQKLKGDSFDVVLTDMRMPAMGGAELLAEARRKDPGFAAVVVSAYTGTQELERARGQGVLAVLPKPVPVNELVELLGQAKRDAVVAVVEDDAQLAENLSEALRQLGYATLHAGRLSEVEAMQTRPFLALVDVRLPDGPDGAAVDLLRKKFPGLPILLITAYNEKLPYEALKIFSKPFDTKKLLAEVEALHEKDAHG